MEERAAGQLESDVSRSLLDGLPDPAFLVDCELRIRSVNRAYRRLFADGDEALGRRCHDVLHRGSFACDPDGLGCPIRECALYERSAHRVHVHQGPEREEHQRVSVHPIRLRDGETVGFLQTFRALSAASAVAHPRRLVGRSRAFLGMLDGLRRAAELDSPVLLQGETGTGKRLAARTIHECGERRHGPLVAIGAASLAARPEAAPSRPDSTWSDQVAAARGGTLLVHEVGDLPLRLQSDLAERLASGEHGEGACDSGARADFRLVCTTSRDAGALARSGALLAELHARIAVAPIFVPSLRERMDDLPLLIDSLLQRIGDRRSGDLEPEARRLLAGACFPGNVRELLGLLERASLLADGDTIRVAHLRDARLPCGPLTEVTRPEGEILPLDEIERRYLEWAVRAFGGTNSELARQLGVAERTLYRKLHELRTRDGGGRP